MRAKPDRPEQPDIWKGMMKAKPGRPKQPDIWKGMMKPVEFKGRLTVVRFLKDGSLQLLLTVSPSVPEPLVP